MRTLFTFTKPEIDAAFQHATFKARYPGIKLLVAPSNLAHGKMLIVIPRTSGKAHDRNRFRRRVRGIFYTQKLFTKPCIWIVIAYEQALTLEFDAIKKFLISSINKD